MITMTRDEIQDYLEHKKKVDFYKSKMRGFVIKYIEFVTSTFLDTPLGPWRMSKGLYGDLEGVHIDGDKELFIISLYDYEREMDGDAAYMEIELPLDFLWSEEADWQERAKEFKLKEWEGLIEAELKKKQDEEARKERKEREE